MKNLYNPTKKKMGLKSQIIIMTLVAVVVKLFGLLRDVVLANYYGASNISDAYLIAFSIPSVLFSLIAKAIATSYVPIYIGVQKESGNEKAQNYTSNLCNYCLIIALILILFIEAFPSVFVSIFAKGFDAETTRICISILRVGCISMLAMVLTSLFSGFLKTKGEYIACSLISLPMNILLIAFIAISSKTNYFVLGFGILISFFSEFVLLLPFIKKHKYRYKPVLSVDKNIKETGKMVLPVMVGAAANQINKLVDKTVASTILVGGVSVMNYAGLINVSMQELFVTSLLGVVIVELSKLVIEKNYDKVAFKLREIIVTVAIVMIPLSFLIVFFSQEIVQILFMRGSFNSESARLTAGALACYAIGIFFVSIRDVYVKVYNAHKNTKIPAANSILMVIINVVLNLVLSKVIGIKGLALASSIAAITGCFILVVVFERKYYRIFNTSVLKSLAIVLVMASVLSLCACFTCKMLENYGVHMILSVLLSIAVFGSLYFGALYIANVREVKSIVGWVKNKFGH